LAKAAWQLVGLELLQDLLERQIDQGMIPVRGIREDPGRGGFTEFPEGDANGALRQLREDLAGGNGNAQAAGRRLLGFTLERLGQF
jgi:hypothetical protein